MVQLRSMVESADNSGGKKLQVFHVFGGYRQRYARVGDMISVSVKEAVPHAQVKKGEVYRAVVVRTKKEIRRSDGSYVRFDRNAAVLIDTKTKEPIGTRIFGPVPRELRDLGYAKIVSLAIEVV